MPHKIWTCVHPLQNTCCVTLSTLGWVFSWLNTWNWNYPNKLFWQLLKVFWSKPECLYSQCFHTESVPVTVILCLFFMLECRFLLSLHQLCKDKNKGTKATFSGGCRPPPWWEFMLWFRVQSTHNRIRLLFCSRNFRLLSPQNEPVKLLNT